MSAPSPFAVPSWVPVWHLALAAGTLVSLVVVWRLARPDGRWGLLARRRLLLGVPWGTLLSMAFVVCVYAFLQGGLDRPRRPLVLPFRAWSYFYPLGVLTAGFSHAGLSHLLGNLLGTLVFGSLAEYAWGHFPTDRGASTFSGWRTNPYARALAFAVAVLVVGVLSSLLALGPVIGFSGVVFALAGFALVCYPVTTVALVLGGRVLDLALSALRSPVTVARASPNFSPPWWAGIAIQGHAVGLLLGMAAGVLVVRRRRLRPGPGRLWFAVVAFGVAKGLWAVYAFRGGQEFVLFRALGLVAVLLLGALVAAAAVASSRTLVPVVDVSRREAAVGLLAAVLVALSAVAVPYNVVGVDDPGAGVTDANSIAVRDYTVFYAEDVPDQLVGAFDVALFNETTQVNASGVIVVNPDRAVWWEAVGARELAFGGERSVRVGGVGWRETVVANRTGWSAVGGPVAYRVSLRRHGGPERVAFTSPPARAEPTVNGRNVTVEVADGAGDADVGTFLLNVSRGNRTLGRAPLPADGESATVGGLTLERDGRKLFAVADDGATRVRVANRERYR